MRTPIYVLSIPPYGFVSERPNDSGSNGTRARVRVACQLIAARVIPANVIVPFPSGFQRRDPSVSVDRAVSLGENVAEYVASQPEMKSARVIWKPLSWTTWDDTVASYKMVSEHILASERNRPMHWHFVSDPAQLGRLWLIWSFTHPRDWTASFHTVPNFRTWKDLVTHEPLAYLKCLWQGLSTKLAPRTQSR